MMSFVFAPAAICGGTIWSLKIDRLSVVVPKKILIQSAMARNLEAACALMASDFENIYTGVKPLL